MRPSERNLKRRVARLLLFWPTALAVWLGKGLIAASEGRPGRYTLPPLLRLAAR